MLWESIKMAGRILSSRLVCTATGEGMADQDGFATRALVERYRELGRDAAFGIIITGHAYVEKRGRMRRGQTGINLDEQVKGLKAVAEAARKDGSCILLQLAHGGLASPTVLTGEIPAGPSECPEFPDARAMSPEEVRTLPAVFARAALRARQAGFDGVELHAAHGFLLSQFLSPHYNRRDDEYGGSPENRTRIIDEIASAVRNVCGEFFIIGIKINCSDLIEGWMTLDDAIENVKCLQKSPLDFIEVSGGSCMSQDPKAIPYQVIRGDKAYFATAARKLRSVSRIPILVVGGIRSLDTAESLLHDGTADLVGICRPVICEPDLARRWKSGINDVSKCKSCNGCMKKQRESQLTCVFRA